MSRPSKLGVRFEVCEIKFSYIKPVLEEAITAHAKNKTRP